ncbi:hypothetical protein CI109_100875 [Kwoniella shandongensis]|uniref:Uncharacterized protein n=1 Tax=Kwoniella shandongensis TaxID=1734106 RepID=A0A5M6BVI0_9TREE|nr:uncharacterized protein CI109_006128 [Kwoniella shandongensis]KAA5525555.1 hypothetical protein CI109_006128 [Kwoniella shandongensis]
MPFASSSTVRSISSRSLPILAASALSITIYSTYLSKPLLLEEVAPDSLSTSIKKQKTLLASSAAPFTPYGWGANRNLTLLPDTNIGYVRRPAALSQLGSTPLRDLVLAENYGACVDANGDCWMWGSGYDRSGEVGKTLRGKSLKKLAPAHAKLFALSKHGNLYVVSPSKTLQADRQDKANRSWWSYLFSTDPGVDYVELKAEGGLGWGERWAGVSAGRSHLLAVTNRGRTFSLPISPKGNSHRQLGTKQELETPTEVPTILGEPFTPEKDIRYATTLTEIPSLSKIRVAQVSTSERTSFVRTTDGHVLGFGANENGQIGLGATASVDIVPVPVEVVLARGYPAGTKVECTDVQAGGNTTFFTVKRSFPGRRGIFIDLLGCGSGIAGALGTGMYTSATGMPVRVKTISGLQEYSEKLKTFLPIGIHSLSISPSTNTHVYATLDTVTLADQTGVKEGRYGKDVMAWGANVDYQIGNGKRSSTAIPQHLPPIGPKAIEALSISPELPEAALSSGTQSPMPHSRLQLHVKKANAYDLHGKLIRRRVKCEETIVAGYNASVLYSKILD